MSSPDPQLVGWWKIQSLVMPPIVLQLIGGRVGERVCFSPAGHYNIHPDDDDIQCYRTALTEPYRELDIWIRGLEPLTSLCLYTITDDILKITIAGRPLGGNPKNTKRPTGMRMDEKLNWAVVEMKRCPPPKKRRRSPASGVKLKPGKLIPDGFLED